MSGKRWMGVFVLGALGSLAITVESDEPGPRSVKSAPAKQDSSAPGTSDPETQQPSKPPADEQLLDDLARIRRSMGGSVLRGSVLDGQDADPDKIFKHGVQSLIESEPEADLFTKPAPFQQDNLSIAKLQKSLREEVSKLDRIANALESVKQYQHADRLRDSANALRQLARQMDAQVVADDLQPSGPIVDAAQAAR